MFTTDSSEAQSLWLDFKKGEDKAFAGIYYAYIHSLLKYGKKLTADQDFLHDAIQDIFLRLYQKRNQVNFPITNLKAYLLVSLRHSILKKKEQVRKFEAIHSMEEKSVNFGIEYSFQEQIIHQEIQHENYTKLQNAIIGLSPGQKEIIYLKFEEEMSYKEIAEVMEISIESARKQLYRALISLRKSLADEVFPYFFSLFLKKSKKNCP